MRAALIALAALAALAGTARAQEGERMALSAAPPEVQKAITSEPQLRGSQVIELSVTRHDLDHDGQEEWLVSAAVRDSAGFAQAYRPTWLFQREGQRWRRQLFLGAVVRAEVVPATGHDAIRTLAKDGARLHCALYRYRQGRYEAQPCPQPGKP
jgi:hypothetical protein